MAREDERLATRAALVEVQLLLSSALTRGERMGKKQRSDVEVALARVEDLLQPYGGAGQQRLPDHIFGIRRER